jgi:lipoprotein-anchoring transpeptidase ErfK/SrfK
VLALTTRGRLWIPPALLLTAALAAAILQAVPSAPVRAASPGTAASFQAPRATAPAQAVARPAAPTRKTLVDFAIRTELPVSRWLHPGEFAWDDETHPAVGETVVVVNLRGRVLSIYRGGVEIGRSSIVWGSRDKPTPTGTFRILAKKADYRSRTYGNAPMPHMQRLTADGVALHGSEMADDIATHGCVGLPKEFAALLFGATKVGDRVLILKG